MYFGPRNLKTWLRAWFCPNCVCNWEYFVLKSIRSRDVASHNFFINHHWGGVSIWGPQRLAATALIVRIKCSPTITEEDLSLDLTFTEEPEGHNILTPYRGLM